MHQLDTILEEIAMELLERFEDDFEILVSGPLREGEGEYKIFEHIHFYLDPGSNETSLVAGSDSDLFVFGLLTNNKVDILRTTPSNHLVLYNIEKLKDLMVQGLHGERDRIAADYAFLSLLCGSDHIPRLHKFEFVRSHWSYRIFKSDKKNKDKYLVHITQEGFKISSDVVSHILGIAHQYSSFLTTSIHVHHKKKDRSILFHYQGHMNNLNAIVQRFTNLGEIAFDIDDIGPMEKSTSLYRAQCYITLPDNNRIWIGSGEGLSKKSAQVMASENALQGEPLQHLIEPQVSKEDFEALCAFMKEPSYNFTLPPTLKGASPYQESKLDSYIRMLAWTMSYFKGDCYNYSDYYEFEKAPSIHEFITYMFKREAIHIKYDSNTNIPLNNTLEITLLDSNSVKDATIPSKRNVLYRDRSIMEPLTYYLALNARNHEYITRYLPPEAKDIYQSFYDYFKIDRKEDGKIIIQDKSHLWITKNKLLRSLYCYLKPTLLFKHGQNRSSIQCYKERQTRNQSVKRSFSKAGYVSKTPHKNIMDVIYWIKKI